MRSETPLITRLVSFFLFLMIVLVRRQNGVTRLCARPIARCRCEMYKYFFDLVSQANVEYDYQGREFSQPEKALEFAELIAMDLENGGECSGWAIHVRNAQGQQLFMVPVRYPDLTAI
jgi:hypothetical protein